MHAPKYFILGIRLLWALKDTFAKLYILRTHAEHCNTIVPKKNIIFQCQLRPKMTIKGRKKIEIKGTEIRKKIVISLCLFRYGTFFEYKTIAKKTCAPKTRATLAMPNIFIRVVVVCLLFVCCRMSTFLCPE